MQRQPFLAMIWNSTGFLNQPKKVTGRSTIFSNTSKHRFMVFKLFQLENISRFRVRRIIYIAIFWTIIDLIVKLLDVYDLNRVVIHSIIVRECLVFIMSFIMGYLFVYTLKNVFVNSPLLVNFIAKSVILMLAALLMNFLVHFVEDLVIEKTGIIAAIKSFGGDVLNSKWLLKKTLYWIVLFIITQLYLEINDKYSPGVFIDILRGKYLKPKAENRIVMFLDLKDSTPIAERLGHEANFLFIRAFIHDVSLAIIEHGGVIYQYVGDEIVVSWDEEKKNYQRSLAAVIASRKNIQKHSTFYRRHFDIIPEFRVGIHVGEVTIGEIGVIKKDLAMSGDTMNTTARIRSACNELNEKFIVSKAFVDRSNLKTFQTQSLGQIELKGKGSGIELFSLKI